MRSESPRASARPQRSFLPRCFRAVLRRFFGLIRLTVLLLVVMAAMALATMHFAEARIGKSLDGMVSELVRWPQGKMHSAERLINLNGLELKLVTATVELDLEDALEAAGRRCRKMGGMDPTQIALADAYDEDDDALDRYFDGVLTWRAGDHGIIACLDTGGPLTVEELGRRAEDYRASHDLSAIGHLRIAQFRAGKGRTTNVLWMWTEGSVRLESLFRTDGDAPGFDPRGFEGLRLPGARRVLAAAEHGTPFAIGVYRHPGSSVDEVKKLLSERARDEGWSPEAHGNRLVLSRGGQQLLTDLATSHRGGVVMRVARLAGDDAPAR